MHELNVLSINKLIENMEAMWIRAIASTQLKMESEYSGRRQIGDERTSKKKIAIFTRLSHAMIYVAVYHSPSCVISNIRQKSHSE